jgi:hypothetical protein
MDGMALMAKLAPRFQARREEVEECLGEQAIEKLHKNFAKLVSQFSQ